MGSSQSSEEQKYEEKTVDSNGHVNNNIVIQEARDTHSQLIIEEKLLLVAYAVCIIEVVKLGIYFFEACKKYFKKKYQNKPQHV